MQETSEYVQDKTLLLIVTIAVEMDTICILKPSYKKIATKFRRNK